MKILSTFSLCFIAVPLMAQVNTGELRLKIIDSTEIGIKATVALSSEANQYFSEFTTDADGTAEIKTLPYGVYRLNVEKQGFSSISKTLEINTLVIFAQRLEKVKLAGSVSLGGVGHPRFNVSAAPCTECLGSPMGLLV